MQSLLKFVEFTQKIQRVRRMTLVPGEDRQENDAEHSYQLALCCWYLNETAHLGLNTAKIVGMALWHDAPEVYAGDSPVFGNPAIRASQAEREQKARKRLASEFPEFSAMEELIEEYEERQSAESRFVYAMDKLLPMLNNYLDGGRSWWIHGITLEQVINEKGRKISVSSAVQPYYELLLQLLHKSMSCYCSCCTKESPHCLPLHSIGDGLRRRQIGNWRRFLLFIHWFTLIPFST